MAKVNMTPNEEAMAAAQAAVDAAYADSQWATAEAVPTQEAVDYSRAAEKEQQDWMVIEQENATVMGMLAESFRYLNLTVPPPSELGNMVTMMRERDWYQAQANATGKSINGIRPKVRRPSSAQPRRTGPARTKGLTAVNKVLNLLYRVDHTLESVFNELQDAGHRYQIMESGRVIRETAQRIEYTRDMLEGIESYR